MGRFARWKLKQRTGRAGDLVVWESDRQQMAPLWLRPLWGCLLDNELCYRLTFKCPVAAATACVCGSASLTHEEMYPALIPYVLNAPEGISKMASSDWLLSEMTATNSVLIDLEKKNLLSDYYIEITSNKAVVSSLPRKKPISIHGLVTNDTQPNEYILKKKKSCLSRPIQIPTHKESCQPIK